MSQVFFHLKSHPFDWKDMNSLKDVDIGATIGYLYGSTFDKAAEQGRIRVERVPSDVINFRKLLTKRIEIFPIDVNVGRFILQSKFKPQDRQLLTHHPRRISVTPLSLLFSKKGEKNKRLLGLFNEGLRRLKASGRLDQYLQEAL